MDSAWPARARRPADAASGWYDQGGGDFGQPGDQDGQGGQPGDMAKAFGLPVFKVRP